MWCAIAPLEGGRPRPPRAPHDVTIHAGTIVGTAGAAFHAGVIVRTTRDYPAVMTLPARKRPVHAPPVGRHNQSMIVLVTACTKDRQPLLAHQTLHGGLIAAWTKAGHWRVGRYVVLPDHLHLFCAPASQPPQPLRPWVAYWKRLVSKAAGLPGMWQDGFWDTQLRGDASYAAKWDYVRRNPVRHGLVANAEDWPYQGELEILAWHE